MIHKLDDYRKTSRWLTRHEIALLQSYDPRFDGFDIVQLNNVILAQECHDIQMFLRPKHQAQIIPLVTR